MAVTYIPAPSFILFCQLSSCAAYVKMSAMAGFIEAEGLEWGKSKKFALIVFGFIGTLFSNVTSLRVRVCGPCPKPYLGGAMRSQEQPVQNSSFTCYPLTNM